MKQFIYETFVKHGYTIPNLDNSKFRIESSIDNMKISIKGINPDNTVDTLIVFNKSNWFPTIYEYNLEYCVKHNVIATSIEREGVTLLNQILDCLYYMFNPEKIKTDTGKVYRKTFKALRSRLQSRFVSNSKVTKMLFKECTNYVFKTAERNITAFPKDSLEYKEALNALFFSYFEEYVVVDFLTGKAHTYREARKVKLSNYWRWISKKTILEEHGYREIRMNQYALSDEFYWNDRLYSMSNGVCDCPICGTKVPKEGFIEEENSCVACLENKYKIHNYSTRAPDLLGFKAKKVKTNTIYFGCELEFETTEKTSAAIKVGRLLHHHAIMKQDGSIGNGFEVVTCPATLDIHLEEFKKFYDNLPTELNNGPRVGMHVHVSRVPLSFLTQGKITEFMNRADNAGFIERIAGRLSNMFCKQDTNRKLSFPFVKYNSGSERYNTVNLCNRATLEFRIFATPLTFEKFASNLEFCQALVDYCSPAAVNIPIKDLTSWKSFLTWTLPQRKTYPNLVTTLKEFVSCV